MLRKITVGFVLVLLIGGFAYQVRAEQPEIGKAVVAKKVSEREPVAAGTVFNVTDEKVWCWSRIVDGKGTTVKHVYYHNDKKVREISLAVGSNNFRTWSWKNLHGMTGNWKVEIQDENGKVLHSIAFEVKKE